MGLRSDTLGIVYIVGLCAWTLLWRSLAGLSSSIGMDLLLMCVSLLRLLERKELLLLGLLEVLRLSMGHLLRNVHLHIDRPHRGISLHCSYLGRRQPLSTVRHCHGKASMLLLLLLKHHPLSEKLLLLLLV